MKTIKDLKNIKNKKVLIRVDFNVPIQNKKILDDFRIQKALPTIDFLQKKGAKIILVSHLGKDGTDSMLPIVNYLKKHIKKDLILLENIRKYPQEEKNDIKFAQNLSSLADFYVNEAFSVSHRQHASVVGIPKFLPSYAGFQLEKEIKNLTQVFENSKHPFFFILGGAKFSTKMPLIKKYLKIADFIFIGGALLNNFLKAKGYPIGKSLVDDFKIEKNILNNKKIILPIDLLVLDNKKYINKKITQVKKSDVIVDIGKESTQLIKNYILKSKFILWNGPLGKYENGGEKASQEIIKTINLSNTQTIIGGGDIVTIYSKSKKEKINKNLFISTGGGATLDFLTQKTLPGIKALK